MQPPRPADVDIGRRAVVRRPRDGRLAQHAPLVMLDEPDQAAVAASRAAKVGREIAGRVGRRSELLEQVAAVPSRAPALAANRPRRSRLHAIGQGR